MIYLNFHSDEGIADDDYWDYSMLKGYFDCSIWNSAGAYKAIPDNVIVISGRHHQKDILEINDFISQYDWVILFIMGDEENDFPVEQLQHARISIWIMSPRPGRHDQHHKLGSGWPKQIRDLQPEFQPRLNEWFFSGQTVHKERHQMANILRDLPRGELNETEGFTQGYPHDVYYEKMAASQSVPCPAGSFTPDSFRFFEALELGCVPIAGAMPSVLPYPDNYWTNLFEEIPFPVISDWNALPAEITKVREQWPEISNKVYGWWQNYKREQAYEIHDTIFKYVQERPPMTLKDQLTVIIPTSPIPSHPSLEIIEQTIESVRSRLPDCEILIMCDGVREEQQHYRSVYNQYVQKLLWKSNWEWENILPIVFPEYSHQAEMTRVTLDKVRTPAILFVEHDCPLEGDIPFETLVQAIIYRKLDMIRLHHETKIGDYHQHLMLDSEPVDIMGAPYVRTVQWSQRPHLANTDYYRKILSEHFSSEAKTMIEDQMHSVAQSNPWDEHRLAIYHNKGNIQHSITTDGRKDDPKYGDKYVF